MNIVKSWYKHLRHRGAGLKGPLRYYVSRLRNSPDAYLKLVYRGIVHVGANIGDERVLYSDNKLKVVWIEPNPEIFDVLKNNIEPYANQKALNALITDRDGETYTLHISSHGGNSSSIFDLHHHKDIWPEVHYLRDISMKSMTLKTALRHAKIDLEEYEVLVMDTQGSELLILKGAEEILSSFNYIKTEAADFEIYKNCCTADQICAFLEPHGFRLIRSDEFARRKGGGACYELLFAHKLRT